MTTDVQPRAATAPRSMGAFYMAWGGQALSTTGSATSGFALSVWVYLSTGSVTRFAISLVCGFVPGILISLFAGVVVDRFDRRVVLIAADTAAGAAMGLLALAYLSDGLAIWHVYAFQIVVSATAAFQWPAFSAAVSVLVPKRELGRANGLVGAGQAAAELVAPLLAGTLLATVDLGGVLLLDLVTFGISILTLTLIRIPPVRTPGNGLAGGGRSFRREVREGWRFIAGRRGLLGLLLFFALYNCVTGAVTVLVTPLVLSVATVTTLGAIASAGGAGMLVGTGLMAVWGGARRKVRTIFTTATCAAVLLIVGGLWPGVATFAAVSFGYFLCLAVINTSSQTLWQTKVDLRLQGRVFSVRRMIAQSGVPISYLVVSALTGPARDILAGQRDIGVFGSGSTRGPALLMTLAGALTIAAAALAYSRPRIRRLESELDDAIPDEAVPDAGPQAGSLGATVREAPDDREAPRAGPDVDRRTPARSALACLIGLGLLVTAGLAGFQLTNPAPVRASAPQQFSATRALAHIEAIASEPRPSGSAAHRRVRTLLVDELRGYGLQPRIHTQRGVRSVSGNSVVAGTVANVVAKVDGTSPSGTVLVVAHYDSVANSNGASDDGLGIATLLETARSVASAAPPRNDVVFVLTDSEENFQLGAALLLEAGTLGAPADSVVLNLEARGSGGPVVMFESGAHTAAVVPSLRRTAPFTSSAAEAVYSRLPNDTDFGRFRAAGYTGMNFAVIGDSTDYHGPQDSIANVDPTSLQDMGSVVLSATQALAGDDLSDLASAPSATYFTLFGALVVYPAWLDRVVVALAVVVLAVALVLGVRRGRLRLRDLLGAAGTFPLPILAASLIGYAAWPAITLARPSQAGFLFGEPYQPELIRVALGVLCAVAVGVWVAANLRRAAADVVSGSWLWWVLLGVVASVVAPGVAHLFAWPALIAAAGLLGWVTAGWSRRWGPLLLSAGAVPGLILFTPLLALLFEASGLGGALGPLAVLALLLASFSPSWLLYLRARARGGGVRSALSLGLVLGLLLAVAGVAANGSDRRHPEPVSLRYVLDADRRSALWVSGDAPRGGWLDQLVGAERRPLEADVPVLTDPRGYRSAPAEVVSVPSASVSTSRRPSGTDQVIDARIRFTGGTPTLVAVYVDPRAAPMEGARIDGLVLPAEPNRTYSSSRWQWGVLYFAPDPSGLDLSLTVGGDGPVPITVVAVSSPLPLDALPTPLPDTVTSAVAPNFDAVSVRTVDA